MGKPQVRGEHPFYSWLRDQGYVDTAQISPDMWAGTKRLLFHWTLHTGFIDNTWAYEDRWCYADHKRAAEGLREWASRGFEGEPGGWRRHPATGRRRNDDGDPASEWVAD